MSDHGFARLEVVDEEFRVVCLCGWRSVLSDRAEVVGTDLDVHLAAMDRGDGKDL